MTKTELLPAITPVGLSVSGSAIAQAPPVQEPSNETDIKNALTGGVPMGRWKEGLLFEGVRPMPSLESAANWFPGTAKLNSSWQPVTRSAHLKRDND